MRRRTRAERPGELEEAFRAAFRSLPLPLLVYDTETQRLLAVNDAACREYDYTSEELGAMTIEDLVMPEDLPALRAREREEGPRTTRWRHRRKDGSLAQVEVASTAIPFQGARARLVAALDVTERERSAEELRTSEARLRSLVDSIDEVFFEFDAQGVYLDLWTSNEAILAVPREEAIGRSLVAVLGEERGRPLQTAVERVIATGKAETVEYALEIGGETRWFIGRVARIPGVGGGAPTASFLARDITERVRAEEALREAEARYRTLVEALPAITYVELPTSDPRTTRFAYLSPQVESLLGYTADEIIGRPDGYMRLVHPDDLERVVAENAHVEATGEPFDSVYRLMAGDGRTVWVHSRAVAIPAADGTPAYWHGVALDVTAEKEAEQALRLAEERYRALVEQLPAVTFMLVRGGEPADMFFTFLSPQVETIFGYPADQLTNDPARFAQLVHPDDRERVVDEVGRASQQEASFDSVFRIVRPDGSVAWVHGRAAPVLDADGSLLFWQGVALDVTGQREATDALRAAEERYRLVVENTSDLITLYEPDGTIVYASPSHERILGVPAQELVGRTLFQVLDASNADSVRAALTRATAGEATQPLRLTATHADGRPVILETSGAQPIRGEDGGVRLVLSVTRDVTERVLAERQREEMLSSLVSAQEEERSRIAADIHDDPIQAMVAVAMQLDLLDERTTDPELRARVDKLRGSVQRAVSRLRHLLFELSPPSLDSGLGAAILELVARDREGVLFEIFVEDRTTTELPMEARVNAFRIVQEALTNVRKHARASRVSVQLETRDAGTSVIVEDDGVGITPERQTSEPGHLGLRGMTERANLMGGWLEVGPRPGGGTYVELWLPNTGPAR